jgi:ribonuclease P protein component
LIRRLSRRDDFHALRHDGRWVRRGPLGIAFRQSIDPGDVVRVAYAISRPVGTAVVRNRLRRRLRSILVEIERSSTGMPTGDDLVRVRPEASDATYNELRQCLTDAVDTLSSPS